MAFREFLEIDKIGKTGENPWNTIFLVFLWISLQKIIV